MARLRDRLRESEEESQRLRDVVKKEQDEVVRVSELQKQSESQTKDQVEKLKV
jgi:hypothetical protein